MARQYGTSFFRARSSMDTVSRCAVRMAEGVGRVMKLKLFSIAMMLIWVPVLIIWPLWTYNEGTAKHVGVRVIAEPYIDSPHLVYEWSGNVYRSCDISLRRQIVDSSGKIFELVDTPFLAAIPHSKLGKTSYEISVDVGANLSAGPAEYRVQEVPRCNWIQRMWPPAINYPTVFFSVYRD